MFSGIEIQHIIGTVIFLLGFVVQHWSLCLLAYLRKNRGEAQLIIRANYVEITHHCKSDSVHKEKITLMPQGCKITLMSQE